MLSPKVPQGYEVTLDKGSHLQLQFVFREDGIIKAKNEAWIFRNNTIINKDILTDLNIYPVNKVKIPENVIGFHIYGIQNIYETQQEIIDLNKPHNFSKYEPTLGNKIHKLYTPKFISFGVTKDNNLNEKISSYNKHIFKSINYTKDNNHISSISLTESLTKLYNLSEDVDNKMAQAHIEKMINIYKIKKDLENDK